jgi:nucleotide-binding universal stress UspA family protein
MTRGLQEKRIRAEQHTPPKPAGQVYRRILVGTDFSARANAAFEQGLKIAKQNNAELLIAHSPGIPNTLSFMPPDCYDTWVRSCRDEAKATIGALIERAHSEGVKAHMLVLEGSAEDAIVNAAKRLGVDLIVIGTHGHRRVSRLVWGSVVAHMISRAPCAVLTVRPSGPGGVRLG